MARMSDAEALMWAVEKEPALRSDFCNLTIVDGDLDDERLRAKIAHAVRVIPRLGQKVVSPPLRLAPPEWIDDADFDLGYHVRRIGVPHRATMRDLLDAVAAIAEAPFDRARPLWEFTVLDGLEGGRTAFVQKVHHTVTDGVGGLRLSLEIVDLQPDAPPPDIDVRSDRRPAARVTPAAVTTAALRDAAARSARVVRGATIGAAGLLTHPQRVAGAIGDGVALAASVRRQAVVTDRARSDIIDDRSLAHHYDVMEAPLAPLIDAAHRLGGSFNDVFVVAVCGALGRYHDASGSDVRELRMAMPVNTRSSDDEAANRFAPTRVIVPIQPVHDIAGRFAITHERLHATKRERTVAAVDALAGAISGLPTAVLVALARSQARTIDFAASNLRGSPVPLYLAGRRILASYPFGPRAGTALNVTLMSYGGAVHIGINLDPMAVSKPELFVHALEESLAEVADVADVADGG